MKISGLDKIYVIHYAKLEDRRRYLESSIKKLRIQDIVEWDIAPTEEKFTEKEINQYDKSEKEWNERIKILGEFIRTGPRFLKKGVMGVTLQHWRVLFKIAKRNSKNVSMIVEDDAVFEDNFIVKLQKVIEKIREKEWDICYTDKGGLFAEPLVKKDLEGYGFFEPPNQESNTTGSYIVNSNFAKKFIHYSKGKFFLACDGELGYLQKKHHSKVLWSVPFLTSQGSIEGIYSTHHRPGSITEKVNRVIKKVKIFSPQLSIYLSRLFIITQKTKAKIHSLIRKVI